LSYRRQTEEALHRLEILIIMQQGVTALDAERPDDNVDRLANRDALSAEKTGR